MSDEVEDRVVSRRGDSMAQRQRTAVLRAHLALSEHPEMSAEQLAEEYGTFTDLIEQIRPPEEFAQWWATHREEVNARARAEYAAERRAAAARAAAFKRLVELVAPKPSLPARAVAALLRVVGR